MGCFQLVILGLQSIQIYIQINALFFQITERLIEAVQFVLMAFCKSGLPCFPTNFQILVMDCLVGLAVCHGVLYAGNDFHSGRCFFHFGIDCLGFLIHALQGGVQIFQSEKLMFF